MFSKTNSSKQIADTNRKAPQKQNTSAPSILGSDLSIKGDIVSDGDIQIDGRLEGNITASRVTIGESGSVTGSVKAKWVHIRGRVSGALTSNVVEMAATANVQADIAQDQLTIANGAFFDGKCKRLTPIQPAAKPVSAAHVAVQASKVEPIPTSTTSVKSKKTA